MWNIWIQISYYISIYALLLYLLLCHFFARRADSSNIFLVRVCLTHCLVEVVLKILLYKLHTNFDPNRGTEVGLKSMRVLSYWVAHNFLV